MPVFSEISNLESLIIHTPGIEHHYTLPKNTYEWIEDSTGKMINNIDYLLFDDLISPSRIANEHNQLVRILEAFTGVGNTLLMKDLLTAVLTNNDRRNEILEMCKALDLEVYDAEYSIDKKELLALGTDEFADMLIAGRFAKNPVKTIFKWPLPNFIFTRDIGVMVGDTLILTWAMRAARKREMLLFKYITTHHPLFTEKKIYDFHVHHPSLAIEGGDIIIFDDETIFIGLSERNSVEAIDAILPLCFAEGFKQVIIVDLPKQRSFMHLDTIFNRISNTEILVYPPLYHQKEIKGRSLSTYTIQKGQSIFDTPAISESLAECLDRLGYNMSAIYCGGSEPIFQEREQWSDGANAFTIRPGKIISYSRNDETLTELKKTGYNTVSFNHFILNPDDYIKSEEKIVFTINSTELPRGRGGPRCLTLPLARN